MAVARGVLWLSVLTFAGFGAAFTAAPRGMADVVEIGLPTDTARTDFAATYGGLELGLAAFLAVCARRDDRVPVGLLASGMALAGFGLVRAGGLLLSDTRHPLLLGLLAAEASGAAVSFWAARRAANASGPSQVG